MKDDPKIRGLATERGSAECAPTHDESPSPRFSDDERARIEERLLYIVRRRYQFSDAVAQELARAALATYAERYPADPESEGLPEILIGILRGRCREHIRRQICLTAQRNAVRDTMPQADVPAALAAGALDDLASRDTRKLILEAFCDLRPKAREALQYIRDGATRIELLDVIEKLGLNQQADAANLRAYRTEFRSILARCGIQF